MNHFELFGLPPRFDLDPALLGERYRELQRAFHPDRFAGATPQERRLSVQRAAQVNLAYHTLRDPLERARYLLELHGIRSGEGGGQMDQEFLMQQMEMREALADVRNRPDPAAALAQIASEAKRMRNAVVQQLSRQFGEDSERSLAAASQSVNKLMFLNKILQEVDETEEELSS
ncbi:MAG TPA: Fe-S protein assembly co-chaperone HscB [Gammaproteobacteria bacterium]|nr:Fe-S protein assembly co-chaperone HscB [Gammaproteobacteria bacterium]